MSIIELCHMHYYALRSQVKIVYEEEAKGKRTRRRPRNRWQENINE